MSRGPGTVQRFVLAKLGDGASTIDDLASAWLAEHGAACTCGRSTCAACRSARMSVGRAVYSLCERGQVEEETIILRGGNADGRSARTGRHKLTDG